MKKYFKTHKQLFCDNCKKPKPTINGLEDCDCKRGYMWIAKEKQTAEENKGREIALTEYIKQKRTAEECFGFIDGYEYATLKLQEKDKEIERLKGENEKLICEIRASDIPNSDMDFGVGDLD